MMVDNVYILDNGAHTAKVELSKAPAPRIVPNCIMKAKSERRRPFIGDQVEECRDASGLFYLLPFQKGFLVNWDVQKTVWDYIFSKDCCYGNFAETPLIVTEPYFNFPSIQEAMSEIFFEEYECQSLLKINANCAVKGELLQLIEILQCNNASPVNLAVVENASYDLRYLSLQATHEDDINTILWKQNHNPLLVDNVLLNSCTQVIKPCKKLWVRKVTNLHDEQLFSGLNLIPTLHYCLHNKHNKKMMLSKLIDFCNSDYVVEYGESCKSNSSWQNFQTFGCNNILYKSSLSKHDIPIKSVKMCNTKSFIEQFPLEEYCDTTDQPVNYSLKYCELESPQILDNLEQPVDFSLKYLEEIEIELSADVEMTMFGAGEMCYAETDSDQPSDFVSNYFEREDASHCDEESYFDCHKKLPLSFSEQLKKYHMEETLSDISVLSKLSDICSPSSVEEAKVEKVFPCLEVVSCAKLNQAEVENKISEVVMLETPLMFSRYSSISSLTSVEPSDEVRSVISEYSRMGSGMISPTDLPDSPTQTSAPSFKLHIPLKSTSVFEEKVSVFIEESTPVQFSTTSSLSALSMDENNMIETASDFNLFKHISETISTDGKDDDDILAACISAGMQKGKSKNSGNGKSGKSNRLSRKVKDFSSCAKTSDKEVSRVPTFIPKREVLGNLTRIFLTQDSPSNSTNSTPDSDVSKLPTEDSDLSDILAECIQAGMPKILARSKCHVKKSSKTSVKFSSPNNLSLQNDPIQKPFCSLLDCPKTTNNVDVPNLKSDLIDAAYNGCSLVTGDSHSVDHFVLASDTGTSPLISPLEPNIIEAKVQLSRRSSIESIKDDSIEDAVTVSELLLLEQCITSGMPKKKTR